ncbi:dual specificity protein phosphatase family protein [Aggregatibacter actinomycetemcomitans]|uniref:dual specificity protein phosphatase family protein n=1 Tax=Aggregatibacter actinomycetemcomitans TaxID=714 RepID=UPI00197BCB28|nr:dual specificity protein phosphatase family protein [Aggregatibacter actinomycetemcomitans]MBN6074850.1 dual specificity protein phosphatase family protein [Aggregatibacter actinomycetemcomitans]
MQKNISALPLKSIIKQSIITLVILGVVSCSAPPTEPPTNTEHWATLISEQENLYRIDDNFYRSEQLDRRAEPLLEKLNIKTIVNLRFFDRNNDKQAFGHKNIKLINTPLLTWTINTKEIADILWQIHQHQKDGPVLVHCYHGADRTGLVVAMYRVVYQNWNLNEAKREMQQAPYGYHTLWKNIDNFFTEKNIEKIKAQLAQLSPRLK